MHFTDNELEAQQKEIARMAEQLAMLNKAFDEQKKRIGLAENEEIAIDPSQVTPELEAMLEEDRRKAEQAGREAAANIHAAATEAPRPRAARRGALRI